MALLVIIIFALVITNVLVIVENKSINASLKSSYKIEDMLRNKLLEERMSVEYWKAACHERAKLLKNKKEK